MTIHQKRFNGEFALWLKKHLKWNSSIYKVMLKANEIWANCNGHYPERDEDWIKDLCLQLLKVIEDMAWDQFDPENRESQDLLCYMYLCELTAEKL